MNFDINEFLSVTVRAISSLVTLFIITKLLGKKQVSQLSLFDYVIGISIGNFAAEMTINLESNELNGIWAVVIFGVFAYIVSIATMKSMRLRRFFMGTPTVIIQDGKILKDNLKMVKLDINDMLEEIREAGYFDLSQIQYAIMEADGKFSILPYSEYRPLTPNDMNIKVDKEGLYCNAIIDRKIMVNNLKNIGKSEDWLKHQLKVLGYIDCSKILLATIDINNKITVYESNEEIESKNILE